MAKLPAVSRLTKDDFKDAPSWFDRAIYILNQFMSSIYSAVAGNLTFVANVRAVQKTITITAGAAATNNTYTLPDPSWNVTGVIILQVVDKSGGIPASAPALNWQAAQGSIKINAIYGLTSGKRYDITILMV